MTQENEPQGRNRHFTDEELRADLDSGLKPAQIAQKYGVSKQGVYKRINQIKLTTTAAVVAPVESQRFVNTQVDILQELARALQRVNLLFDACDDWLRDVKDPTRYDIGARDTDVMVTYWEAGDERMVKARAKLSDLLARIDRNGILTEKGETHFADPRQLVLSTASEVRQIVTTAANLSRMLADARAMEQFRQIMLDEIRKESPEVAQRIAQRLRSSLLLYNAAGGPGEISSGG